MANERTDVYPVGIQSFEYIRKNDLLYVDKTDYIRRLTQLGTKSFSYLGLAGSVNRCSSRPCRLFWRVGASCSPVLPSIRLL